MPHTPGAAQNRLKKNEFSSAKWAGKRAVELGSGMGLGGMALSLVLGMQDVTLTDVASTLPMLRRNCEANLGVGQVRRVPVLPVRLWYGRRGVEQRRRRARRNVACRCRCKSWTGCGRSSWPPSPRPTTS